MIILRIKSFSENKKKKAGKNKYSIGKENIPNHLISLKDEAVDRINNGEDRDKVINESINKYTILHRKNNWKRDDSGLLVKGIVKSLKEEV